MMVANDAWRASAAYLYVLLLEGSSLAWEYLRRNHQYRRDWHTGARHDAAAVRWGLVALENPDLDARQAQPLWQALPESVVRLTVADESADAIRFSLWSLQGRKALVQDRRDLRLTLRLGGRIVNLVLARDLKDGRSFAYVIAAGPHATRQWRAACCLQSLFGEQSRKGTRAAAARPTRAAMSHMRSLQALDGILAGASHREVAQAIFGVRRVAEGWHPDGELRAQTRHCIHRAHAFMGRDYRRLIGIAPEGDDRAAVESPSRGRPGAMKLSTSARRMPAHDRVQRRITE